MAEERNKDLQNVDTEEMKIGFDEKMPQGPQSAIAMDEKVALEQSETKYEESVHLFEAQMKRVKVSLNSMTQSIGQFSEKMKNLDELTDVVGDVVDLGFRMLNETIDGQNEKLREMEDKLTKAKISINVDNDPFYNFFYWNKYEPTLSKCFIYKMSVENVRSIVKKKMFEGISDVISLREYPFDAIVKLGFKDDNKVYVTISFQTNKMMERPAPLKILPEFTVVLKDVKNQSEPKHQISSFNYSYAHSFRFDNFCYELNFTKKTWLTHEYYNVNDSVQLLLFLEPPSISRRLFSTNGRLVHCIDNYGHRVQLAKGGYLGYYKSPYFSTSSRGYRVGMKMWMNGHGAFEEQGLTAHFQFLTGEFDSKPIKEFCFTIKVTLINQRELGKVVEKTIYADLSRDKHFYVDMATFEYIESEGYSFNDSIVYQVEMKKLDGSLGFVHLV